MAPRALFILFVLFQTLFSTSSESCERLKASLSYTQEQAPRDLSGVLPVVVERVNQELDGVVDVEVEWNGSDLHGKVGDHFIQCKVTRLVNAIHQANTQVDALKKDDQGRHVIVQCFTLSFTILDTNECTLPKDHPMHHNCHDSAICVNTIGSYECLCPKLGETTSKSLEADEHFWTKIKEEKRSGWELSYAIPSKSSCPLSPSSFSCCSHSGHSLEGKACRKAFTCPTDPCVKSTCDPLAQCIRNENPLALPNHSCMCPNGLMGNGRLCGKRDLPPKPMVMYDGITPTEETVKNNYYCGCNKPEIDACAGFPPCQGNHQTCVVIAHNTPTCACEPGYVDNQDGYGCVDESPPILKLRPDGQDTMTLHQGDFYKEHAVDVVDENAEEYFRSLRITYSEPLPPGCLVKMGRFHVNYTIATPWTSYQFVRVTRNVIVNDIDECSLEVKKYSDTCPQLIPQCHESATCINTIGSYTCQCPKFTSGDGFKKITSGVLPDGYQGGTGCVDTSKPVITLKGPNPKIIKVCKCGVMGGRATNGEEALCTQQRNNFGRNLKDLIDATKGSDLCATHINPNPKPGDCVKAIDNTFHGVIDITPRVVVGTPVEKSRFLWSVPYDVMDAAGNQATTVWRDVVVEEVDIGDIELRIRREVMAEVDKKTELAVKKAVAEERAKYVAKSEKTAIKEECPICAKCAVCKEIKFDVSKECPKYCDARNPGSCEAQESTLWDVVDGKTPILYLIASGCFIIVLRFIITLWFNPGALLGRTNYDYGSTPAISSPTHLSNTPVVSTANSTRSQNFTFSDSMYGAVSRSRQSQGGLFSPKSSRLGHSLETNGLSSSPAILHGDIANSPFPDTDIMDIYADSIVPSERGDYRKGQR